MLVPCIGRVRSGSDRVGWLRYRMTTDDRTTAAEVAVSRLRARAQPRYHSRIGVRLSTWNHHVEYPATDNQVF